MEQNKHTIENKSDDKKMRIGELSEHLKVESFVIRFWEKEFGLSAERSSGGQRFYKPEDIEKFKIIRELLYKKGYTIAGAKKHLKKLGKPKSDTSIKAAYMTDLEEFDITHLQVLYDQCLQLKEKLLMLKKLL